MKIVTLDLEGVLVPEIWIEFARHTGIKALERTTRDEPDYGKLMRYRIDILKENHLRLKDIQNVIGKMDVLEGAKDFLDALRSSFQVIILSDTFCEFASPLMRKLSWPTIFSNSLAIDDDGYISGIRMRIKDGKKESVKALKSIGFSVFASGDSYNDISMIDEADWGVLFRAPENIRKERSDIECVDTYSELLEKIRTAE
ncbi:MAG TPA: bifunctional phosphoserine phosphatase/homoserine phosphotransferase ThrH [Candidatus Ornithospirochaeta avicola]|uniref:phosphoserine phosphatase n=1 Tax=Candidatus Ornithospirochaeta avicola TaxID=2840896 RepID=A0A9D1PSB2_9SPIO|nr:bifunctional phosphoserine phosphatase/homoserine phosphotransferase ThrH [Candidatus Ornithospirochaeta avicola]